MKMRMKIGSGLLTNESSIGVLIICLSMGIVSCGELDSCDPPFSVGGVFDGRDIRAGEKTWLEVVAEASSVTTLKSAKIVVIFPDEIEIRSITKEGGKQGCMDDGKLNFGKLYRITFQEGWDEKFS